MQRSVVLRPARAAAICAMAVGAAVWLGACGGGGGGSSASPPPQGPAPPPAPPPPAPPPPSGPSWTSGTFEAASTFKDRCEVVRTGRDIEGNTFPDRAGSALEERFWLRSWTNETYLWNTEVTDRNPADFANRRDYFAILRSFAQTASGKEKDDFHFSEPTTETLIRRTAAPRASYGASLLSLSAAPPRDFRVRYTEPGSPAAAVANGQANLERGSRILRINGIDFVNATSQSDVDQLNAALFPSAAGVATTFTVQDADGAQRTVTLTSENLSPKPVNRTSVISTSSGNVGYIVFNTFSPFVSEREIVDAMTQMSSAGVSDLVLDLRYNGGGLLAVASQLGFMVAGDTRTRNNDFERLRFNAAAGNRNPVTGSVNQPIPFYTTGLGFSVPNSTSLPALNLPRVFVLTTASTCSASEAVINGLRGVGVEVIQIGNTTCGKPFGFYPQDNCGETYYTIQFQGVNTLGFGDYADGFIPNNSTASFGVRLPGCSVADDLTRELGDPNEGLLSAALTYRSSFSCPTTTAARAARAPDPESSVKGPAIDLPRPEVMEINRDMSTPPQR